MIVTLTPNPAVDQTIVVPRLEHGAVNRFERSYLDPAGKGVNVSRVVHRLAWPTIAFGFAAGEIGTLVENALEAEGVEHHFVRVPGQTRINITIVEEAPGRATSLYGPGPAVDPVHVRRLEEQFMPCLPEAQLVVLGGSLPPGLPDDTYASYIERAREQGVRAVLDTDGEPLRRGVAARPFMIKPNAEEAGRLLGRTLSDLDAVVDAAHELAGWGIEIVVISLGGEGAVCVAHGRMLRVVPPRVERRSTVGSGDSFVAGVAVALCRGETIEDALRLGAAAGAATSAAPGTKLGSADSIRALVPAVRVVELG